MRTSCRIFPIVKPKTTSSGSVDCKWHFLTLPPSDSFPVCVHIVRACVCACMCVYVYTSMTTASFRWVSVRMECPLWEKKPQTHTQAHTHTLKPSAVEYKPSHTHTQTHIHAHTRTRTHTRSNCKHLSGVIHLLHGPLRGRLAPGGRTRPSGRRLPARQSRGHRPDQNARGNTCLCPAFFHTWDANDDGWCFAAE